MNNPSVAGHLTNMGLPDNQWPNQNHRNTTMATITDIISLLLRSLILNTPLILNFLYAWCYSGQSFVLLGGVGFTSDNTHATMTHATNAHTVPPIAALHNRSDVAWHLTNKGAPLAQYTTMHQPNETMNAAATVEPMIITLRMRTYFG